jgi:hypothetical protein
LLDDAGAATHPVTIKKATSPAPLAARRLRRLQEAGKETRLRRVRETVFAGDSFLPRAMPAPSVARTGSLGNE